MQKIIKNQIDNLRKESKELSILKANERQIFNCKMAQISILQKILREVRKMEKVQHTDELQKGFINVLIDIEGYLLDGNKDECLDYVLKVKKELLGDINN